MGSFAVEDRIIRIHPALDQDCVPDYFVAWIVFHEMLHGKHEVKRENGRRRFHSAAFLDEERTFPEYDRACAWEKENLDRLLAGIAAADQLQPIRSVPIAMSSYQMSMAGPAYFSKPKRTES